MRPGSNLTLPMGWLDTGRNIYDPLCMRKNSVYTKLPSIRRTNNALILQPAVLKQHKVTTHKPPAAINVKHQYSQKCGQHLIKLMSEVPVATFWNSFSQTTHTFFLLTDFRYRLIHSFLKSIFTLFGTEVFMVIFSLCWCGSWVFFSVVFCPQTSKLCPCKQCIHQSCNTPHLPNESTAESTHWLKKNKKRGCGSCFFVLARFTWWPGHCVSDEHYVVFTAQFLTTWSWICSESGILESLLQ